MDFSYLSAGKDTGAETAEFVIYRIEVNGKSPTLILRPATQANKAYFNAALKRANVVQRRARGGNIDGSMLSENRESDRKLFAAHVVVGWRDVHDSDGSLVEFNEENCRQFLQALPDWIFDEVRDFANDVTQFVAPVSLDIGEAAKN